MATDYEEILTLLREAQKDLAKINGRIEKVENLRVQLKSDRDALLTRIDMLNTRKASVFGR